MKRATVAPGAVVPAIEAIEPVAEVWIIGLPTGTYVMVNGSDASVVQETGGLTPVSVICARTCMLLSPGLRLLSTIENCPFSVAMVCPLSKLLTYTKMVWKRYALPIRVGFC